jgi:hypothetical protein
VVRGFGTARVDQLRRTAGAVPGVLGGGEKVMHVTTLSGSDQTGKNDFGIRHRKV